MNTQPKVFYGEWLGQRLTLSWFVGHAKVVYEIGRFRVSFGVGYERGASR